MATAKNLQPTKASLERDILEKDLELRGKEIILKELEIEDAQKYNQEGKEREIKNVEDEIRVRKVYALIALMDSEVLVEDSRDTVNVLSPTEIEKVKKKIFTIIDKF